MKITIPDFSLVVLIGTSSSGKSSFARNHFQPTEIVSSDTCRAWISDSENNQRVSGDAFALAYDLLAKRLKHRRLSVFDATNLVPSSRKPLLKLARQYHCVPVAIVLDMAEDVCDARRLARADRKLGPHVLHKQRAQLKQHLNHLAEEGFRKVYVLNTPAEVEQAVVVRQPMPSDRRLDRGPFDIIGDIHGCFDELCLLLAQLGYQLDHQTLAAGGDAVSHPNGRRVIFLGDLVDRGPNSPGVLTLVMNMVRNQSALCVAGNHEITLLRWLQGKEVKPKYGLAETIHQFSSCSETFKADVAQFIASLVDHLVLDDERLVVAHAGLRQDYHGRLSGAVRAFALYGETTGETDAYGLPVRYNWAGEYKGRAYVVYGHTPVLEAVWVNRTICLDTGCVFGGQLTALRYPERTLVSVPATCKHYAPVKPLTEPELLSDLNGHDRHLDLADIQGKQRIETGWGDPVTVTELQNASVLNHMTQQAVDPRWLIYLPPRLASPPGHAVADGREHPAAAFAFFRGQGLQQVDCRIVQPGHSVITVVCRSAAVARARFGVSGNRSGVCYDRLGRPFFRDPGMEGQMIARLRNAIAAAHWWQEFDTDWFCFALRVQPWFVLGSDVISDAYAGCWRAESRGLAKIAVALQKAADAGVDVSALHEQISARRAWLDDVRQGGAASVGSVSRIDDLRITPSHVLASNNRVHMLRHAQWHDGMIKALVAQDSSWLQCGDHRRVELDKEASVQAATRWWARAMSMGQLGMVVDPMPYLNQGESKGLQPLLKVPNPAYAHLFTSLDGGPYALDRTVDWARDCLAAKQSMALGLEGLTRFVQGRPLRDAHACVYASLALRFHHHGSGS